ncbi:MAG: hypothetical protein V4805_04325 [Pseudomonadota bacterium]
MKKRFRPYRVITACIMLFSMLFMQFAMASYVCPGMGIGSGSAVVVTSATGVDLQAMSGCDNMDMAQPGLCHAHAYEQTSKQSLDKPDLPSVEPFVPGGLVVALVTVDLAASALATEPESQLLTRTTAPPIAIRHCCFRI